MKEPFTEPKKTLIQAGKMRPGIAGGIPSTQAYQNLVPFGGSIKVYYKGISRVLL